MEVTKRKPGRPRKVTMAEAELAGQTVEPNFEIQVSRQEKAHENVQEKLVKQPHGGSLMRQRKDPAVTSYTDPLEFLQAVYRGEVDATNAQITAAKAMLPFVHKRVGEEGKKKAKEDAAKQVSDRFGPAGAPPKLAASGGRAL